jgi:mycothiol system anti-sigma-R factor
MSGCEHAVEYVYQYIDDEMTVTRRARITVHLKMCSRCTDAYEFERRLKAKIAAAGKPQPPAELFDHLRALIEQERSPGGSGC